MDEVPSYFLAEEEPLEVAICRSASETQLLLKNIPPETHIDHLELHIDTVTNGIAYEIASKPGNLYLLFFKSPIGVSGDIVIPVELDDAKAHPELMPSTRATSTSAAGDVSTDIAAGPDQTPVQPRLQQLDDIKAKILQIELNGANIEIEEVPASKCVIISNIDEIKRTKEYLGLYFSNPNKCGVRGFDHIDLLDNGQVIVHFEDSQCVRDVLQKSHTKLGQNVRLHTYDRFTILEEIEPKLTDNIFSKDVPHVTALFAKKCESSLRKSLDKMHANIDFVVDDGSENSSIHITPKKGHEEVRHWKEKCKAELEQFLVNVCTKSLAIKPELLPALQTISDPSVCMDFAKDQTTLYIAGYCEDVTNLVDKLKHIEDTELDKTESISLEIEKVSYIAQASADDLFKDHPNVDFTIIDDHTVQVTGKKMDRNKFKDSVEKLKLASTLVSANQEVLDSLSLSDDQTIICRLLQNQKEHNGIYFSVYCDHKSHKFYIVTSEQATANKLARYVKQNIHRIVIKVPGNAFDKQHFNELCMQLKEEYIVNIAISSSEIEIIGDRQDIVKVEQQLNKRIKKKYFITKEIKVSNGCWRFISEQLTEEWSKLMDKSKIGPLCDVKITFPEDTDFNPIIQLEGEESLIALFYGEITTLIESVCSSDTPLVIDYPGFLEFLNSKEGKFMIQGIERDVHTCVEVITESNQANEVKEICAGVTKEGKRIKLVEANIETFRVDVIVNVANKRLKHSGGVALAISKKGGPKIQCDSDIYIKCHGELSDGEAIMRDEVGNLPCKKIIHTVGPVWKQDGKVEEVLMSACIKSLELAYGFKSIAFPAISSGIFKFPVEVSANSMIQAICTWSENFPQAPLSSIYIVVHEHAVSAFTNAIKTFLNTSPGPLLFPSPKLHPKPKLLPVEAPTEAEVKKPDTSGSYNVPLDEIPDTSSDEAEVKQYHEISSVKANPAATNINKPIQLYKGELLSQQAEVYVNSTSKTLVLTNGTVSKHMLEKGGQALQDECNKYVSKNGSVQVGDIAVTGPGQIPCKHIIHTVGTDYDFSYGEKSEKILKEIVLKCLKLCDNKGATTIAFPALGAGSLKYPAGVVAKTMVTTVQNYYETYKTTCIKEVKFVLYMDDTYKEFEHALSHCPKPTVTPIKICKGKLLNEEAEVYVNTTSDNLVLSNGEVSKHILRKAGKALQTECNQYISSNGKIQVGDIAVTGPGKISCCKFIIHTVGKNYDTSDVSKSEQILEGMIQKCLEECNRKGATTIAFPAIGSGTLNYPTEVVAKVMITTIQNYYQTNAITSIKEVKIVLLKNNDYKKFEHFFSTSSQSKHTPQNLSNISLPQNVQSSPSLSVHPSMGLPQAMHRSPFVPSLHRHPPMQNMSISSHPLYQSAMHSEIFKIGDVKVQLVCGDITNDTSDVIVNTTQCSLQLETGKVSKSISQKAGPNMQQSCSMYIKQNKKLNEGKVFITEATGQLKCKMVFHIVVPNGEKASALSHIVTTCLNEANGKNANSIALPAIGTGGLSYNPTVAAQGMFEAIIQFGQTNPVHLKHVRIVIFQKSMYQVFVQKCIELTEQPVPSKPSFLTQCLSVMPFKSSAKKINHKITTVKPVQSVPQTPTVQMNVYGRSPEAVQQAEESLSSIIYQQFEGLCFSNSYISYLKPEQILQLNEKAAKLNLAIEVNIEVSQIKIRGRKDNVQQLKDVINKLLHDLEKAVMTSEAKNIETQLKKHVNEAKSLLQTEVKWQFLNFGNQYVNYDPDVNFQIEQAYKLQKNLQYMNSSSQQCTIYFDRMQEENSATGSVVKIQRIIDSETAEFPSTWQYNTNEIVVVPLTEENPEYIDVKNGFESTVSGSNILKIERIQNPSLYAVYAARKKWMVNENPPNTKNEQKLYHGCPGNVTEKIIHQGFNRSYAGVHQPAYGDGVYFAVNAGYSANGRYSKPDTNGNKHMFLARVLTGEYTQGSRGMKVPPPKDPIRNKAKLFDSVVDNTTNPNMFVIFHDAHCYPEYLITFKITTKTD